MGHGMSLTPDFSDQDLGWMRHALDLAREGERLGEVPVGAVLVREGVIIAEGWNQPIRSHDPTAHAEIEAIRRAGTDQQNYRLPGSTLYVSLEPCIMCLGAICHARVQRVVFGASDPRRSSHGSALALANADFLNHRVDIQGGLLEAEASALLQGFFRARRKPAEKIS